MRLLIYGINHAPELTGIGKYTGEMAGWLAARGHEVRVVTAPPYYPEWRVYPGFSGWRYLHDPAVVAIPRVMRCPLWIPRRVSGLTRLLHLFSFAVSSLPAVLVQAFWRPQVVLVVAPAFFCAPGGLIAARLCGATAWLHVQDFEIDAAFDLGILRSSLLRNMVSAIERFIMRRFDRVSTISSRMMSRLADKGVAADRRILFPNWVDTRHIFPVTGISPIRNIMGASDTDIVVLYSGNMGEKQGLDMLLDAAQRLETSGGIRFVMCGDGAARERLQAKYARATNVCWIPLQPVDRLNDLLGAADIHVLPQRADAADLVMPSKLTGMMASGRAIVAAALPGTQIAEVLADCGIVVAPGDDEEIAMAITQLAGDPSLRSHLGTIARTRAVDTLGMDAMLTALDAELMSCAAK